MALDRNIWRSRISVGTKLRLYNSCILPIFLYCAEIWAVTATAADIRCSLINLRRILNIHWTERITSNEVRSRTRQPLLSDAVRSRRLRFFGHICRADPNQDHSWHCTPVLPVCPSTGVEDLAGRDRPGYELSRMIYGHSIWVWRQLNGVCRIEQLGRHSWKRLRRWQAPDDDDDDDDVVEWNIGRALISFTKASETLDNRLMSRGQWNAKPTVPAQPHRVSARWPVPNYTALYKKRMSKVVTRKWNDQVVEHATSR